MNQSVLIIGPDFFGYNNDIKNAFIQFGWSADCLNYLDGRNIGLLEGVKYLLSKEYIVDPCRMRINKKYDLILIVKGTRLSVEMLHHLRNMSDKMVLWLMDPLDLYAEAIKIFGFFDHIFSFQYDDVEKIRKINNNCDYLPLFCSKVSDVSVDKKNIDLIFIGNLYGGREKWLNDFCKNISHSDVNFVIYGGFGLLKVFRYFRTILNYPFLGKYLRFGLVGRRKMEKLYLRSKASLNIHAKTQTGLNMRFFELYGFNVYQFLYGDNLDYDRVCVDDKSFCVVDDKSTFFDIDANMNLLFNSRESHLVNVRIEKVLKTVGYMN